MQIGMDLREAKKRSPELFEKMLRFAADDHRRMFDALHDSGASIEVSLPGEKRSIDADQVQEASTMAFGIWQSIEMVLQLLDDHVITADHIREAFDKVSHRSMNKSN